jgi:hypothetical protein
MQSRATRDTPYVDTLFDGSRRGLALAFRFQFIAHRTSLARLLAVARRTFWPLVSLHSDLFLLSPHPYMYVIVPFPAHPRRLSRSSSRSTDLHLLVIRLTSVFRLALSACTSFTPSPPHPCLIRSLSHCLSFSSSLRVSGASRSTRRSWNRAGAAPPPSLCVAGVGIPVSRVGGSTSGEIV